MSLERFAPIVAAVALVTGAAKEAHADPTDECRFESVGDVGSQRCELSDDGRSADCLVARGEQAELRVMTPAGWDVTDADGHSLHDHRYGSGVGSSTIGTNGTRTAPGDRVFFPKGEASVFCKNPDASGTPPKPGEGAVTEDFIELQAAVREASLNMGTGFNESTRYVPDEAMIGGAVRATAGVLSCGKGPGLGLGVEGSIFGFSRDGQTSHRSAADFGLTGVGIVGQIPVSQEIIRDSAGNAVGERLHDTRVGLVAALMDLGICGDGICGRFGLGGGANLIKDNNREIGAAALARAVLEVPLHTSVSGSSARVSTGGSTGGKHGGNRFSFGVHANGTVGAFERDNDVTKFSFVGGGLYGRWR